jgi:dipeptidyl aminopeptidase/acylaminoacyl peptidase
MTRRIPLAIPVVLFTAQALIAQENAIVPGDNLVVEGVPRIPATLAEDVARYTEFRSASLQDWHPTRREMLITTRFGDAGQVHRVKMPLGARSQLTFYPDPAFGATYDPRGGQWMLFRKDVGGTENWQIYRYDFTTGDVTLVTDGKSRNTGGSWSTKGDRFAYESTRRTGSDSDVWIVDPTNPKSDRLAVQLEGGGWGVADWSPDDRQLLLAHYTSITQSDLWLADVGTGEKRRITPAGDQQVAYLSAEFSTDGRSVYVTTDRESEFQRLARIDLATGAHTYLSSHIKWDIDEFDLSWDGRRIAYVANEDGVGVLRVRDVATGRETRITLPVGQVFGLVWHRDNRTLGFTVNSARSPSDVYAYDVTTQKLQRWTESETGGLVTSQLPEPELVKWTSFDGRTISGFLYRPPSRFTGKRPVIVNIHGGPEGQFRPGFVGRTNYYLNELGIAVLYPNVRGSTGYGKTFVGLDNGFKREDSYKDILSLFDWLKGRADLDVGRVLVTGGSYGGFMTLQVATNYADRICCAVDIVGVSNLVTFLENTAPYRRDLRRVEYGDERDPAMREFMNRIAAVNNAHKITKPLFVVQGGNDPRVPRTEAEQIVAAARKNGTPVWYLMAKDEGHGFQKKKNVDFLFYSTVMFVKQFLTTTAVSTR